MTGRLEDADREPLGGLDHRAGAGFFVVVGEAGHAERGVRPERAGERAVARAEVAADRLARLGGDEFSFLLTDLAHFHDAAKVAHRILDHLKAPFRLGEQEVFVTASTRARWARAWRSAASGMSSLALKMTARLPAKFISFGYSSRKVATRSVWQ